MSLRVSSVGFEGVYQGSKWLKFQVLCDEEELKALFDCLNPFSIYPLTGIVSLENMPISQTRFLSEYASWIELLKKGEVPDDAALRTVLASAFTAVPDALWLQDLGKNRFLVKIAEPVIQVQAHYFSYSAEDGVFRPMSMGMESIFWGLQFSFPQIYQDPKTMEFLEPKSSPNKVLFQKLREWVREKTRATPFLVEGKKINSPIRIGKKCFSWIGSHPQLPKRRISIDG